MDSQEALERIGRGTVAVALGFATGSILDYALKVVLARGLQPQLYGAFMQAFALVHIAVVVAVVGLNQGLPRMVSYFRGRGREDDAGSAVVTAAVLILLPASLLTTALYLGASSVASVFGDTMMVEPLRVMALGLVPMALFYISIASLRGVQNARMKVYLADVLHPFLELLLVLSLFLFAGLTVRGVAYAHLFAALVASLAGVLVVYRKVPVFAGETRLMPRKLVLFAWPLLMVGVMTAINKWIDVLMLGWFSSSAAAGTYEVAMAVSGFLLLFLYSVRYMFMPVASELYGGGKVEELSHVYSTITRWLVIAVLPVFIGMMVFPRQILSLLFGPAYISGVWVVRILVAGYLFATLVGPAGMVLLAAGRTRLLMWSFVLLGLSDTFFNLLLIPRFGMEGAALGMTAAFVLSNAVMLGFLYRSSGLHPFTSRQLRVFAAAAVSLIPFGFVMLYSPFTVIESMVIGAGYVLVYVPLTYLMGCFSHEDAEVLEKVLTVGF